MLVRLITLMIAVCALPASAQQAAKPPLDYKMYDQWTRIEGGRISNDGNYLMYAGIKNTGSSLLIANLKQRRSQTFPCPDASRGFFTTDSKMAVVPIGRDSLCILDLGNNTKRYLAGILDFVHFGSGAGEGMACRLNDTSKTLRVMRFKDGTSRYYHQVNDVYLADGGKAMVLNQVSDAPKASQTVLQWLDLETYAMTSIWTGPGISAFCFDRTGGKFAFISQGKDQEGKQRELWIYQPNTGNIARQLAIKSLMPANYYLDGAMPSFNKTGEYVFIGLFSPPAPADPNFDYNTKALSVWNYKDSVLQNEQMNNTTLHISAVVSVKDSILLVLTKPGETISAEPGTVNSKVLVRTNFSNDADWLEANRCALSVVDLRTGKKDVVKKELILANGAISPDEKYILYYDGYSGGYFSYTISSGKLVNISSQVPQKLADEEGDHPRPPMNYNNSYNWSADGNSVLIYDRYDIWQVDPAGVRKPLNITKGYGRSHQVVFRILAEPWNTWTGNNRVILSAFSLKDKSTGFFRLSARGADPEYLIMSPHFYHVEPLSPNSQVFYNWPVIKAANSTRYIVTRSSVAEAPNYFGTNDFKSFRQISDNAPQKRYNWMSSELIKWNQNNGRLTEGILYKPENFDPSRKYPMIVYIYERIANELNLWHDFEQSSGDLNIPYYVSNGYLVFTPDIYYKVGEPGNSAYESVASAVDYLRSRPFIDMEHLGLQGHSFGGFEGGYIATVTDLFKAISLSSAPLNLTSAFGQSSYTRSMTQQYQLRMGSTLWNNLDGYLRNSAYFHADRIHTPLLLRAGKEDNTVLPQSSLEMFTALRGLGKKAWLLYYENSGHQGGGMDYTIRQEQFFNHYLKNNPEPVWMSRGVPARLKGTETGLEIDTTKN
ncbi:dipeptidyl aminopeptidase/acylaminoacyl peptidase [Mucilaginibacter gracilis]|uniref:Dipeptidyl aminopeptidase/acylaminoacyl peptidase n=1 Tax=Mucilaginibacter gracilis TaxID=423350 RepID=A0A495IT98_9SPHI|nr:prolyl oligopeptidase family serine peptidase [Mucilaginibacter gracilis]RKR80005.1 dipeptidyl aminopeptidase/acylaminoacyl peptidase [Mucilaginibacter gracilis]